MVNKYIHEAAQAVFIDMAAAPGSITGNKARQFTPAIPPESMSSMPWSPWGSNNLFPQEMMDDIETCGILSSIIDGKARFALCEGMTPVITTRDKDGKKMISKYVDDPEILDFLETNCHFNHEFGWFKDLLGMGNGVARFMLDKAGKKIVSFQRDDITETRFEKRDPKSGKMKRLYYSADWSKTKSAKDKNIYSLPLLDANNPLADLTEKAKGAAREFAMAFKYPAWGKHYYTTPMWYAAYKWVKIAQGVPEMKAALYQNTMRIKYIVIIYEDYWQNAFGEEWNIFNEDDKEAKRAELYSEIGNFLVGAKNAHKSLFVNGSRDKINGHQWQDIEIKPITDTTANGEYLPDSAAANSEIAFAMLFNPAIIGASLPSGPYTNSQGGSNVRESVLLQIILHELERRFIGNIYTIIKKFNGWDKKHPGLDFIIPATVLTTLDTGAGSKPVVLGDAEPNTEKPMNDGLN